MRARTLILFAGISGGTAVGMGAFGAHGLRDILEAKMMLAWEKAVLYQFVHTLALLILAAIAQKGDPIFFKWVGYFWISGILLFSGSLYLITTGTITGLGELKWLGPVTPFGGLAFILGWITLFIGAFKQKKEA